MVEAFSTAGCQAISRSSAIIPPLPLEIAFANEGIGPGDSEDASLEDFFTDDDDEQADHSREPGVEDVTLSDADGEELEFEECVGARATGEQHRKRSEGRTVCLLAFAYMYLDKSGVVLPRESLGEGEK